MIANFYLALCVVAICALALLRPLPQRTPEPQYVQVDLYQGLDLALAGKVRIIAL